MITVVNAYVVAGGAPPAWQPDDIASLQAWYDVSSFAGADGSSITTWVDSMGSFNGTDSGTQKAILQTAEQNGLNVAQFTNSGANWPNVSLGTSLMNGASAGTFFAVFKLETDPPSGSPRCGSLVGGFVDPGVSSAHHPFTDGVIYDNFGAVSRRTVGNPTSDMAATYRIYAARTAPGDWKAFLDGVQLFSTGSNTVFFGTATAKYIGRNKGTEKFAGYIAEILIFNTALSSGDREKAEGYLAHKWGIAANLDAGHPYKSAAP